MNQVFPQVDIDDEEPNFDIDADVCEDEPSDFDIEEPAFLEEVKILLLILKKRMKVIYKNARQDIFNLVRSDIDSIHKFSDVDQNLILPEHFVTFNDLKGHFVGISYLFQQS